MFLLRPLSVAIVTFLINFAKIQNIIYYFLCFTQVMVISTLIYSFFSIISWDFLLNFSFENNLNDLLNYPKRKGSQCNVSYSVALHCGLMWSPLDFPYLCLLFQTLLVPLSSPKKSLLLHSCPCHTYSIALLFCHLSVRCFLSFLFFS